MHILLVYLSFSWSQEKDIKKRLRNKLKNGSYVNCEHCTDEERQNCHKLGIIQQIAEDHFNCYLKEQVI